MKKSWGTSSTCQYGDIQQVRRLELLKRRHVENVPHVFPHTRFSAVLRQVQPTFVGNLPPKRQRCTSKEDYQKSIRKTDPLQGLRRLGLSEGCEKNRAGACTHAKWMIHLNLWMRAPLPPDDDLPFFTWLLALASGSLVKQKSFYPRTSEQRNVQEIPPTDHHGCRMWRATADSSRS